MARPDTQKRRRRLLSSSEIAGYDHVADGLLSRVKVIESRFLPNGADGLTIGRFIFMKPGHFDRTRSSLMAHELVHVRQFSELGPARFIARYVYDYLKNLVRLRSHRAAYLAIPFEVEAREVARRWAETQEQPDA